METETNLTAIQYGINDLRLENTPIPDVEENEVLLRMSQVGICGTDVSFLTKGRIGNFVVETPRAVGHEGSGVVVKCGSTVKHLKPGDRVAIEPAVACMMCEECKGGRNNLCPNIICCSTPEHGNLARYYKHVAHFCFKLPDHVSSEEGALLEPLSVAVHACRRANVTLGSRVLVCGAGPIGILSLLTAKAMGATKVCVTDIIHDKLKIAEQLGADVTLNVKSGNEEELAKQVTELMDGKMPDITIECSGAESSIRLGIFATKSGGKMMLVGVGPADVKVPIVNAVVKELDLKGVLRYLNSFPLALEMVASGRVDVKPLITHRYKLEETVQAFETASTGEAAIKVMISC